MEATIRETTLLCCTATSIGFLHTLLGPDHYLPFVAMSKAGGWSLRKTMLVTFSCGIGHVVGSALLGLAGVGIGLGVLQLGVIDSARGEVSAWLLIAFGLVYLVWGTVNGLRSQPHKHLHAHADGTVHVHEHSHSGEHVHAHDVRSTTENGRLTRRITPWVLFTIFLFGPCEPLIPIVMYSATTAGGWGVLAVTAAFGSATILTMIAAVMLVRTGVAAAALPGAARLGHVLAGGVLVACGVAVKAGL